MNLGVYLVRCYPIQRVKQTQVLKDSGFLSRAVLKNVTFSLRVEAEDCNHGPQVRGDDCHDNLRGGCAHGDPRRSAAPRPPRPMALARRGPDSQTGHTENLRWLGP